MIISRRVITIKKPAGPGALRFKSDQRRLEETTGRIVYEVTIVASGAKTKFVVDPKSGLIK